jgi:hypothetical protein
LLNRLAGLAATRAALRPRAGLARGPTRVAATEGGGSEFECRQIGRLERTQQVQIALPRPALTAQRLQRSRRQPQCVGRRVDVALQQQRQHGGQPQQVQRAGVRRGGGARQLLEQPGPRQRRGLQRMRGRPLGRHAHQHLRHPAVQRVAPEQHHRLFDRVELALGQRAGTVQVLQQAQAQRGVGLDGRDHRGVVLVVQQPLQQLQRPLRLRRQRLGAHRLRAAGDIARRPQHGGAEHAFHHLDRRQVEQQQRHPRPAQGGRFDRLGPRQRARGRRQRHEVGPSGGNRHRRHRRASRRRRRRRRGPADTHAGAAQSGHQHGDRCRVVEHRVGAQQQVHARRPVRVERGRRQPTGGQRGQRAQALAAAQAHRAEQVAGVGQRRRAMQALQRGLAQLELERRQPPLRRHQRALRAGPGARRQRRRGGVAPRHWRHGRHGRRPAYRRCRKRRSLAAQAIEQGGKHQAKRSRRCSACWAEQRCQTRSDLTARRRRAPAEGSFAARPWPGRRDVWRPGCAPS